jgi:type IV pilus assembly protein PilV
MERDTDMTQLRLLKSDRVHRTHVRRDSGFTLVEILVALIVLSIGMLGIAALYLESLRAGRSALIRTDAVNLAADLGDRIRANRVPANAYACPSPCIDPSVGGNDVADTDLTQWLAAIAARLPDGAGAVVFAAGTATTPDVYTITVSWRELGLDEPIAYQLRVEI